jgi:hypothetical protein
MRRMTATGTVQVAPGATPGLRSLGTSAINNIVADQIEVLQHAVRAEGRSERLNAFSADVVVGEAQARERRVLVEGRRERPMDQARERCVRMPPGAAARAALGRSRALLRRRRARGTPAATSVMSCVADSRYSTLSGTWHGPESTPPSLRLRAGTVPPAWLLTVWRARRCAEVACPGARGGGSLSRVHVAGWRRGAAGPWRRQRVGAIWFRTFSLRSFAN